MSNQAGQLTGSDKYGDLRRRLIFLILALIVYRIGTHIPVPGVNPRVVAQFFDPDSAGSGFFSLANMFSGGALSRFSIFALGIMPYISASIVMQLLSHVVPFLERIKKEGEAGKRKITQYTRYGALLIAFFQAYLIASQLATDGAFVTNSFVVLLTTSLTLATGTMFLMWLGEQITERGLGNGISIIIFSGIVAGLPSSLSQMLTSVSNGIMPTHIALLVCVIVVAVIFVVVFIERGQRKIPVNYARRQVGNKMMGGQSSFLPLKLNMAGVIPPIFASSIILLPAGIAQKLASGDGMITQLAAQLRPGQPIYVALFASMIVFFCFFYTALVFNSRETADNLKKSGAFVPGYRPGEQTARYIDKVLMRLTLIGAIYITLVCLLPEFLQLQYGVQFYFGGTSLLIIVVVTMDFWAQVQNYMVSQQYESLFKKANSKSGKR